MSKLLVSSGLLYFLCVVQLRAADKVPEHHKVDFPKGNASWSLQLEKIGDEGKPEDASRNGQVGIQRIDIVRVGGLRRDVVLWEGGGTTEYWWVEDPPLVLFQAAKNGPVQGMKSGQMQDRLFDASTFAWINGSSFKGVETLKGRKCLHYQTEITGEYDFVQKLHAWIDEKTFRPLMWQNGQTRVIFTFDDSVPSGPLSMPEKFKKELQAYQEYYSPPKKLGKP